MNELTEGQEALRIATGFECPHCYDSAWLFDGQTLSTCCIGITVGNAHGIAINQLGGAINFKLRPQGTIAEKLSRNELDVARALVRATLQRPVRAFVLAQLLGLGKDWQREVKQIVHTLRNEWHLPIGSSRKDPAGYYWIASPEDFIAWFEPLCSQARNELRTAYSLMRRHYPELAGQFVFNFEEEATTDDKLTDRCERA